MANILTSGSFIPSTTNTPIDARTVILSLSEIYTIQKPYVGMIVYVRDEYKFYVVTSLNSSVINGIPVPNTVVGEYEPLVNVESTDPVRFASAAEVNKVLKDVGIM